jgi:hypothetical protein
MRPLSFLDGFVALSLNVKVRSMSVAQLGAVLSVAIAPCDAADGLR